MTGARLRGLLLGITAVLAGLVLLAWSQPWFTLTLTPGSGEGAPLVVRGDVAAGALAPLALTTLALVAALAISGRVFRVILGVLEAFVGVSVVIVAAVALGDPAGASASAVTSATAVTGHDSVRALIESVDSSAWPVVAVVLGAILAVTGALCAVTGPRWPVSGRRYSRTRTAPVEGAEPDPIAEWDALSEGDDPTGTAR
ncbi:Trp biosynthesis-associated membrane protein [Protaetiibacter larvae]|uniref:Trp biosynthesis-associated membrane protein n=1 Tax=Protaetiibacter larvae TaxID=2592654 RepID=A0A5C1YA92_9MICO|nr:Trp biosynthesis-associated membrane protein [Protaetiibacter larvae]QEO10105.1 Trp biosynthesis-associated membrane protein [Protaetiibacter larvae]